MVNNYSDTWLFTFRVWNETFQSILFSFSHLTEVVKQNGLNLLQDFIRILSVTHFFRFCCFLFQPSSPFINFLRTTTASKAISFLFIKPRSESGGLYSWVSMAASQNEASPYKREVLLSLCQRIPIQCITIPASTHCIFHIWSVDALSNLKIWNSSRSRQNILTDYRTCLLSVHTQTHARARAHTH